LWAVGQSGGGDAQGEGEVSAEFYDVGRADGVGGDPASDDPGE